MKLQGKLIISLIIAALASALLGYLQGNASSFGLLFGIFATATLATTLLGTLSFGGSPSAAAPKAQNAKKPAPRAKKSAKPAAKPAANPKPPVSGKREEGEVKWFNVTKGFGFITRDNGEEIFVHFRSIRGEGRRSLRDGQRVTYVVSNSDKGPQAEDVEGLE